MAPSRYLCQHYHLFTVVWETQTSLVVTVSNLSSKVQTETCHAIRILIQLSTQRRTRFRLRTHTRSDYPVTTQKWFTRTPTAKPLAPPERVIACFETRLPGDKRTRVAVARARVDEHTKNDLLYVFLAVLQNDNTGTRDPRLRTRQNFFWRRHTEEVVANATMIGGIDK